MRTLTVRLLAVWLLALSGSGCLLLLPQAAQLSEARSPLPPVPAPRDAIELEVYFVDRRIGDPLIGESLWSSLYAITAVSPDVRAQLGEDGFRFAMSPSRPPRSLQSLLRLSNEHDPSRRVVPRRYTVPSGQETLLVISDIPDGTALTVPTGESFRTVDLRDGQCLLRVQAERVEDGWAKLVIVPEIRHGAKAMRPIATDQSWEFREGQNALPFFRDRLSAELNTGEIVVLGMDPQKPDALASHFFRSDVSQGIERLILVRVAGMRRVDPVRVAAE